MVDLKSEVSSELNYVFVKIDEHIIEPADPFKSTQLRKAISALVKKLNAMKKLLVENEKFHRAVHNEKKALERKEKKEERERLKQEKEARSKPLEFKMAIDLPTSFPDQTIKTIIESAKVESPASADESSEEETEVKRRPKRRVK